jgi:hypothetical protein
MRAEDFDQATIEELQIRADRCFDLAQSPLEEPLMYSSSDLELKRPINLDDAGKLRLLLEAQFYVTAIAKKKDDRVARRDFRLEVAVIILIGIEIILSIVGIGIGIHEANQQAKVFSNIETSSSKTATAMGAAATSLKTLADQQTASVNQLQQMNTNLQESSKKTGVMATASQKQLRILQDEQASRQAQLAKKPKLMLYVENVPANTIFKVRFKAREETDTSTMLNLTLANEGESIASQPLLRIIINNKDVTVTSTEIRFQKTVEPIDSTVHVYLAPVSNIRPNARIPMIITFTYPKNQPPFDVDFTCDADEIPTGSPLGSIQLKPRKSLPD